MEAVKQKQRVKFSIEGSKDNPIYEAVDIHPKRWNGWLCPIVTIEVAEQIAMDLYNKNDPTDNEPFQDVVDAIIHAKENLEDTVDVGCGLIWDEVQDSTHK